jgi:hypothetical protein
MVRFLVLAFAQVLALSVYAQAGHPRDVSSIDAIIDAYYEVVSGPAGESVDAARDRFLHHPEAWVSIAGRDGDGTPLVNVMALADYHGDNLAPGRGDFMR